jgi:cytochrome c-type biogenesis protein CcmH
VTGFVSRIAACALLCAGLAHAQPAPEDPLDVRLKRLETDLRCLVCQNQTLADSDAPLAVDLRREIRELAVAGKSDDDVRQYLLDRYGDFVLYKPRFTPVTAFLWLGPFALLVVGVLVGRAVLKARARALGDEAPSETAERKARDLLRDAEVAARPD